MPPFGGEVANPLRGIHEDIILARFPRTDGRPQHPRNLRNWAVNGVRDGTGQTVKLQAVRVGRRWLTRLEWVDEFVARLTAGPLVAGPLVAGPLVAGPLVAGQLRPELPGLTDAYPNVS